MLSFIYHLSHFVCDSHLCDSLAVGKFYGNVTEDVEQIPGWERKHTTCTYHTGLDKWEKNLDNYPFSLFSSDRYTSNYGGYGLSYSGSMVRRITFPFLLGSIIFISAAMFVMLSSAEVISTWCVCTNTSRSKLKHARMHAEAISCCQFLTLMLPNKRKKIYKKNKNKVFFIRILEHASWTRTTSCFSR